jgi:hypothetical protein
LITNTESLARAFDIEQAEGNNVQLKNKKQLSMKNVFKNLGLWLCAGAMTVLSVNSAQAQSHARVGLKGGLNLSNLYVNDADDENARIGWHAGVYGQIFSSEAFAIQPEVNFSTKGTGITYGSVSNTTVRLNHDQKFNLSYIDIPVLAVFKLGRAAEIHAGPYWAYLVKAEIRNNDGDPNNEFDDVARRNFDDWDYGLVGGIGFNLGKGAQLGVRYNYGLNEIANNAVARRILGNAKNQVAQLYLAFNLNASDDDDDDYNNNGY